MIHGETEMETIRISTTILMVFVSIEIGVAEIVTKPTSTEVVANGSTFLNCSTNSRQEIHWFHTSFGSNQGRDFVYGYDAFHKPYIGRFQMEKTEATGAYNLVIPSVKIEDAGLYECQDETGAGSKASAQLIVLDANPVCEPQLDSLEIIGPNKCGIEPNQLILSCTAKYHGNEAPIIAWRRTSDNRQVSEGVTFGNIDNDHVMYNLTIKGNSTVKDGDSYFCNTTRSTTLDGGCKSGEVKVKGTGTGSDCSTCVASGICEPYIKPYKDALICFFLIILPTAVCGTILALWYLKVHRPKKSEKGGNLCGWLPSCSSPKSAARHESSSENSRSDDAATTEAGTAEEMVRFHESSSSPGKCADGPKAKIKTLENELKKLLERIKRQDEAIKEHNEKEILNNEKINSLELKNHQQIEQLRGKAMEIEQLQAKVKEHEQCLYLRENIDYLDKPVLAHTILSSEKNTGKLMSGITVLGKDLFVVTKGSPAIEVYDSKTFQHQRNIEVRGLTNPLDIASSKESNCLYIVDRLSEETESRVVSLGPTGKYLHQWPTGGKKGRLSTYGFNVILCLPDKQLIKEYSPNGELIVTVRLSPAAKLNNPLHAIKVTSTYFVVSHGDFNDELHRVCLVDLDGEIKNECTKWDKSNAKRSRTPMKVPICLMEDNRRSVFVADMNHNRILMMNSMLEYQRKLTGIGSKDFPFRLCFDDTQSRLFVAVNKWSENRKLWEDGRIQIFNIK